MVKKEYKFKQISTVPQYIIKEMLEITNKEDFYFGTVDYSRDNKGKIKFEKSNVYIFKNRTELNKWINERYKENPNKIIIIDNKYKEMINQNIVNIHVIVKLINSALSMLFTYNKISRSSLSVSEVSNFQKSCFQMESIGIDYSKALQTKDFVDKKVLSINNEIIGKLIDNHAKDFRDILERTKLYEDKERLMNEYKKLYMKEPNVDYDLISRLSKKIIDRDKALESRKADLKKYKKSKDKVVKVDFSKIKD